MIASAPLGIQPTKSARGSAPLRFWQGLALSQGRGISRYGEHPDTTQSVMTIEDCIDSAYVLRWLDLCGEGAEHFLRGWESLPLRQDFTYPFDYTGKR